VSACRKISWTEILPDSCIESGSRRSLLQSEFNVYSKYIALHTCALSFRSVSMRTCRFVHKDLNLHHWDRLTALMGVESFLQALERCYLLLLASMLWNELYMLLLDWPETTSFRSTLCTDD
jgi:hypothetical protein